MHRLLGSMKTDEHMWMVYSVEQYSGMAFVRALLSPAVIIVLVAVVVDLSYVAVLSFVTRGR